MPEPPFLRLRRSKHQRVTCFSRFSARLIARSRARRSAVANLELHGCSELARPAQALISPFCLLRNVLISGRRAIRLGCRSARSHSPMWPGGLQMNNVVQFFYGLWHRVDEVYGRASHVHGVHLKGDFLSNFSGLTGPSAPKCQSPSRRIPFLVHSAVSITRHCSTVVRRMGTPPSAVCFICRIPHVASFCSPGSRNC